VSPLAISGGDPVLRHPLPRYKSMSEAEAQAVVGVVRSGTLSGFYGSWSDEFWEAPRSGLLKRPGPIDSR